MNTEKEQKVLEYLEKKEQDPKLVYNLVNPNLKEMVAELERQGFTKEKLAKDIEEFNSVVSGMTRDDLSPETAKRIDRVVLMKLRTLRRIFEINGEELPEIKTIS